MIVHPNINQDFAYFNLPDDETQQKIWILPLEPLFIDRGTLDAPPLGFQLNRPVQQFSETLYWFSTTMDWAGFRVYMNQKIDVHHWKEKFARAGIQCADVASPPSFLRKLYDLAVDITSIGEYKYDNDNIVWRILPKFWAHLEHNCPSLKTLVVILEPNPSSYNELVDLEVVSDWQGVQAAEEPMVLALFESVDERKVKGKWVVECKLMRKKTKKVE
jgi:hypothetical protein